MRAASPASPALRTLIATARFNMESCGRDKLHLSAIGDQRRYFVHEVSKASIPQSIRTQFCNVRAGIPLYNCSLLPELIGDFFCKHYRRRVGVPARNGWHDRSIDNAQILYLMDA